MNPRRPEATHVAVRDGMILGTGNLEELAGWGDHTVDDRFADRVILPGFIEGHCHSWEGSAWEDTFLGFFDRAAPDGVVHTGLKSIDEVVNRLRESVAGMPPGDESVLGWGFDPIFFGGRRMVAADLDKVSETRPVLIMHQSGHIVNANHKLMAMAGINRDLDVQGLVLDEEGNPTGELRGPALRTMAYRATGKNRFKEMGTGKALWRFAQSALRAGVTTATDLANELPEETVASQVNETAKDNFPLRMVPAFFVLSRPVSESVEWAKSLVGRSHEKLRLGLVKFVVDGSIQGFSARLKAPGYYNGHENGLWYIEPREELPKALAKFHKAGLQIHLHTNGDEATEAALDAIEIVLRDDPAPDARFTLQHCQMAHDAHFHRMASMGVCANLFSNHLFYWGDQHYSLTMGPERAERLDAAMTAKRHGVNFSIHSDAPVTHLAPLFTAWCAVNRQTASGRVLGEGEKISVADALHAITLGAAYTLKLDVEIGSIETGKRADFAILEEDPMEVDPADLKDIKVWGTMVGGRVFSNAEPFPPAG